MRPPAERDHNRHHEPRMEDPSVNASRAVVVVGIDGSGTSWDAFHWACGETRRLDGRTVAVFVGSTSGAASAPAAASGVAGLAGAVQQTATEQAAELGERVLSYAQDLGLNLTFVHTRGDTVTELLRIAGSS